MTPIPNTVVLDPQVSGWRAVIPVLSCLQALRRLPHPATLSDDEVMDMFKLKWPNDIMCDGRKLGGILIELVTLPTDRHDDQIGVVFVCGMNLNIPADNLTTEGSTSMQLHLGTVASSAVRYELSSRIVTALRHRVSMLLTCRSQTIESLRCEMSQECWSLGRHVMAKLTDSHGIEGIALRV